MLRKAMADAVGTFALVFAGCGAIVVDAAHGGIGHVGISLVFGLVVGVMVSATGHVSGAHFNPAVTLAFAVVGRFPWRQVPAYVAAQLVAAISAASVIALVIGDQANLGTTAPTIGIGAAFTVEVVLTFFLMFVITAVATDSRASGQMAAIAIGGAVALGSLMGGPLTGASMNPARSIGPALVSGHLDALALYVVAPVVGAVLGALTYGAVSRGPADTDAKGSC